MKLSSFDLAQKINSIGITIQSTSDYGATKHTVGYKRIVKYNGIPIVFRGAINGLICTYKRTIKAPFLTDVKDIITTLFNVKVFILKHSKGFKSTLIIHSKVIHDDSYYESHSDALDTAMIKSLQQIG